MQTTTSSSPNDTEVFYLLHPTTFTPNKLPFFSTHLLQQQNQCQLRQIHTKTLTVKSSTTVSVNNTTQQPHVASDLIVAHESIANSYTDLFMATTHGPNERQQHIVNNNNMKLLSLIPSTSHAVVSFLQHPNLLFIVDMGDNGRLINSFNIETIQREQKFYHCSDFGQIKLGNTCSVPHDDNGYHTGMKNFDDSLNQDQFILHGSMFCYYRRSDGQLFGGRLELKKLDQQQQPQYVTNHSQSYFMTILFRMCLPHSHQQLISMFPDCASQTAFIAIRPNRNTSPVYCLYLRPMNDVYINMRYELTNVHPTTITSRNSRLIMTRNGETIAYLKDDNDSICVVKVGQYGNLQQNGSCSSFEYNLKKIIAKWRMMSNIECNHLLDNNSNQSSKPKKKAKWGLNGFGYSGDSVATKTGSIISDQIPQFISCTNSQQQNYRVVAIVHSDGAICCVQQSYPDNNNNNQIRIVNVITGSVLEFNTQQQQQSYQQQQQQLPFTIQNNDRFVNNENIYQVGTGGHNFTRDQPQLVSYSAMKSLAGANGTSRRISKYRTAKSSTKYASSLHHNSNNNSSVNSRKRKRLSSEYLDISF